MTKKSPKQILKDMEFLQSKGIQVPLPALAMVQQEEMKQRGIKQFYRCPYCKNPGESYESPVNLSMIHCSKGHVMKKVWQF